MVFHCSLNDSKSPQVSRTLLSILAVLNNVVVWMVYSCPPTSQSSSPFSNPLVTGSNTPITIGIIVTCMFHSFVNSLARSRYLSFFSHSFSFILWSAGTANRPFCKFSILFIIIRFGLQVEIKLSVCMSNPIGVYVCHSAGKMLGCAYTIWSCGQISVSCTTSCGSPCPPSRVLSYTPSVLICSICLLCDWWFYLCHRIVYICYFVASYLFSLWYKKS